MAVKSLIKNIIAKKAAEDYNRKLAKAFPSYKEWESRREFSFVSHEKGKADNDFTLLTYEEISATKIRSLLAAEDEKSQNGIIIFHSSEGELSSCAKVLIGEYFNRNPEIGLLYGDEDDRERPFFKPDWSPDRFRQCFYIGSVYAVRMGLLKDISDCETLISEDGSRNAADVLFERAAVTAGGYGKRKEVTDDGPVRAALNVFGYNEMNFPIGHIDEILFHRNKDTDLFYGRGPESRCLSQVYGEEGSKTTPDISEVSVIIPSKDNPDLLKQCIDSLYSVCVSGSCPEVVCVDNGSDPSSVEEIEKYFELMRGKGMNIKYLYEKAPFNFSHMCNSGAKAASGAYLLFLNDDTEFTDGSVRCSEKENLIEVMAGFASRSYAGAVGAKLLYPYDEAGERGEMLLQHAGVVNVRMNPWHILKGLDDREEHYYGYNRGVLNVSAVTGACLMVARDRFEMMGGFSEELPVNFNDTDICYRLLEAGFYNIECNDLYLIHHESVSRGNDELSEAAMEKLTKSQEVLKLLHPAMMNEDPFYSRHFNKATGLWPFALEVAPAYSATDIKNADSLFAGDMAEKWKSDVIRVGVDNAGPFTDYYKPELPDRGIGSSDAVASEFIKARGKLIYIDGYSFVIGSDNALFDRRLVLMGESGECKGHFYTVKPEDIYRKDIETNTPDQINTAMSGFRAVIHGEALLFGTYRIGVLASSAMGRMKLLGFGIRKLNI